MTKVGKFSKFVCDHLVGFELVQDLILKKPTEHIVRGFLLDRSSTKDCYYLLRLVIPLFSPVMPNLSLNYSQRISLDGQGDSLVNAQETGSVELMISEILSLQNAAILQDVSTPEGFISYCSSENIIRPNMKVELAIAHCFVGNYVLGKSLLIEVIKSPLPEQFFFVSVQRQAQRVLDALEAGGNEFSSLLQEFENANMQKHFPQLTRL